MQHLPQYYRSCLTAMNMSKLLFPILLLILATMIVFSSCGSEPDGSIESETREDFFVRATPAAIDTPAPTYVPAQECEMERGTSCPGADLSGLDLGTIMGRHRTTRFAVDLRDADFTRATFVNTNLEKALLEKAVFRDANLENADLGNSSLYQADFTGANLQGATLDYADAEEAIFEDANLAEATLIWMNLVGANLRNANLSRVDLTYSDLSTADTEGATFDDAKFCGTTMPDGSTNNTDCDGGL